MTPSDGTYTGQYLPKVSGLHYVSIDAYRRNPNVPLQVSSAQLYLHALPVDQSNFTKFGIEWSFEFEFLSKRNRISLLQRGLMRCHCHQHLVPPRFTIRHQSEHPERRKLQSKLSVRFGGQWMKSLVFSLDRHEFSISNWTTLPKIIPMPRCRGRFHLTEWMEVTVQFSVRSNHSITEL